MAGDGDDSVAAGDGNDTLYGGFGDDQLFGGAGNDTFQGEQGNDSLFGGDGDDTFYTSSGSETDTIYGGTGRDRIHFISPQPVAVTYTGGSDGTYSQSGTTTQGTFYSVEEIETGSGNDTIDATAASDDLTLTSGAGDDTVYGGSGNDLIYAGDGNDTLSGNDGNDTVYGGSGNDYVNGGTGNDVVYGGGGDDVILGEAGDDQLFGGSGADIVQGNDGADYIDGGEGNDFLDGGTGADSIDGGSGDDVILGGDGKDTIAGESGRDTIQGDAGDDVIYGDAGNAITSEALKWDLEGPSGTDLSAGIFQDMGDMNVAVNFTNDGGNTGVSVSSMTQYTETGEPFASNSSLQITGNAGPNLTAEFLFTAEPGSGQTDEVSDVAFRLNDVDISTWQDIVTVTAFDLNGNPIEVILTAEDPGNDSVSGDTVTGNGTADTTNVAAGSVLVNIPGPVHRIVISYENGGTGGQALWITDVHFDTVPDGEADSIDGGTGNDVLYGGGGADEFAAAQGQDTVYGGGGNDTMRGGATDADRSEFRGGSGDDTYIGGSANDTIYGGSGNDSLTGGGGDETVYGGDGNDTIDAGGGDDQINGGWGDDSIVAGAGNDTIDGGRGADKIDAGSGNDAITFSNGDSVDGGSGDDTFDLTDFGSGSGSGDITLDGNDGFDTLRLGSGADMSTLVITSDDASGKSGTVQKDDGSTITFSRMESIICFTPGARILTPRGLRAIETLGVGDQVLTRDHGMQPIRWIQSRTVPATGRLAPIRIRPGVIQGQQADLVVSPQHRMLIQGHRAELLFGETEVLVAAQHLIDDRLAVRESGGEVTYLHIMFDQHEVIYAEGAPTESYHPGDYSIAAIHDAARAELFDIFPTLRSDLTQYGRTARRCLKGFEAQLLAL